MTTADADLRLMGHALELARRGLDEGELPIGSLVAAAGDVVAEAWWSWSRDRQLLLHPELAVLLEAGRRGERRPLTLYTTLEPCLLCMGAAATAFVERIVFALRSEVDGAAAVFTQWSPVAGHPPDTAATAYRIPAVTGGVRADESAALVREYLARGPDGPVAVWARGLVSEL